MTGRGKADVIVRRKQSVGDAEREYVEVLERDERPTSRRITFAHEIEVRQSDTHIDNAVHLARGEIDVTVEPTTTWDALSYKEPIASDVEPILFPWGGVKTQTYKFDGTQFTKAQGGHAARRRSRAAGAAPRPPSARRPRPAEPPTPKVGEGGDLLGALLDQYRKDRGVGAACADGRTSRCRSPATVQPRARRARRARHRRLWPRLQGGTAYAFLTLSQFADPRPT